jgi:WbqC-like protein
MNCVILQPSYIPWRGFFHLIQKADVFVFYDCVQYDDRSWRNRNRIKSLQGLQWLSIPVNAKGAQIKGTPISEIPIVWDSTWNKKHWAAIKHSYSKAPYFAQYAPMVEEFYVRQDRLLADFTCDSTIALARALGIHGTRFIRSSSLQAQGTKTERLLSILTQLGAKHYISGPSAKDYIEMDRFNQAGITVEYMNYGYPEYPQLYGPFEPQVSILDLLFMTGPAAAGYIWAANAPETAGSLS